MKVPQNDPTWTTNNEVSACDEDYDKARLELHHCLHDLAI